MAHPGETMSLLC